MVSSLEVDGLLRILVIYMYITCDTGSILIWISKPVFNDNFYSAIFAGVVEFFMRH